MKTKLCAWVHPNGLDITSLSSTRHLVSLNSRMRVESMNSAIVLEML